MAMFTHSGELPSTLFMLVIVTTVSALPRGPNTTVSIGPIRLCGWDIDTGTPGKAGILIDGLGKGFDDTYLQDTAHWFWWKGNFSNSSIMLDRFDENTLGDDRFRSEIGRDGEVGGKYFRKWIIRQENSSCAAAGTCIVYAVCTDGCPTLPDIQMGWGAGNENFNTAVFPDMGILSTTWSFDGQPRAVSMVCQAKAVPKCTETCDAAKCASVPIKTCEDKYVSPCCEVYAAPWMPPKCVCKTSMLVQI